MKLGLQLGYWGAQPNPFHVPLAQEAERLGFDSVWTAEAWGIDAFTPATWIGAHTERIRLCTGIVQISARTPASCAMHTLTIDHLTDGRFTLGLGVSGPQVVEGWYGQPFGKPLARTREYIEIVRAHPRPRGTGRVPGRALPHAVRRPERVGAGQAAAFDHASVARRPADLARRRRAEERRARGRGRRRLAAAVLLAVPSRGVRRFATAGGEQAQLRDLRQRHGLPHRRRHRRSADADEGRARRSTSAAWARAAATSTWS